MKTFKLWKIILLVAILFFPVKWFIYTPLCNQFLSLSIENIDESTFQQKLLEIAAFKGISSTYSNVDSDHGNGRPLSAGEIIKDSGGNSGRNGQTFTTLNSSYVYEEKGVEPIWKSCVYKKEGDKKVLLRLPGNCNLGTWLHIVASNKSSDLLVYEYGLNAPYYIVQDNGTILKYNNIFKENPTVLLHHTAL